MQLQFCGQLAAKHGDFYAHLARGNVDLLDSTDGTFHRAGGDLHRIADLVVDRKLGRGLNAHLGNLSLAQGLRLGFRADKTGAAAGVADNVPGIIGMAKAASIANTNMSENIKNISAIRDHIIDRVLAEIPYSRVNGDRTDRLPGNVHFCFRFIEGESMLIMLDQKGICGSSGSACTSGSLDPSHVLLAIGLPHEIAHGSLRLSLGEDATIEDADYVVDELKGIVERLRSMSPLYEDYMRRTKEK